MTDKPSDNKDNKLTDILKKAVTTGISAAFMTEDAVKGIISDLPLPKDMVNGLLQNAKETKEEFVKSIKNELKTYLNKIDVSKEIEKIVEKYDFEIKASVSLKRKPNADTQE
jgi:polyhydroxyalkanoate synthesis regulator phasin